MKHNYNEITKDLLPRFREAINLDRDIWTANPDGYADYNLGIAKKDAPRQGQYEHNFFLSNTAQKLYRKHLEQLHDELRDELVKLTNKIGEETL